MNTPVYIIGFMGAGKSTLGAQLANHVSLSFIDLDDLFEQQHGCTVSQWFHAYGEASFRDAESMLLAAVQRRDSVIATGGGIVMRPQNRSILKYDTSTTIWLHPAWDVLWDRIKHSNRPLVHMMQTEDELRRLWHSRLEYYRSCADHIITAQHPFSELAALIE